MQNKQRACVFNKKRQRVIWIVMDIEVYSRREKMLKLREELLAAEEDRIRGRKGYTVDEASDMLDSIIREAKNVG